MGTISFKAQMLRLSHLGIGFDVKGDKLIVSGDLTQLSEEWRQFIRLHKADIIHLLQDSALPPIQASSQQGPLPLSFAQQRLWLLDQIDGGSSHYHMPVVLQLQGQLDLTAAHSALQQIVARHAVLRTIFLQDSAGEPYQQVQADAVIQLAVEDVSTLTGAAQQSAVQALVGSMLAQPFDLSRDLMLRASLIKQSEQQHVLVANMHHIASDGWSMAILTREFAQLYQAAVTGAGAGLAPLPVQYSDYARWQRDYLQGEVLAQQLDYWQQQLADVPVLHSLPLERARPQQQSFAGGSVQTVLDAAVTAQLKQLCQAEGATLFMGLHALFSALLARYSNETDIVLGSPVANREQVEVEGVIGFFVNTLVLRSRVDAQASVQDLVRQSRETCLGAYAHQQVPFEKLVEVLQVERSLSHHPLFQVMLVLQNTEDATLELPGLQLTALEGEWSSAKFDLTLNVAETDQELLLNWEYSTDLFTAATITQLAAHFNQLVMAALAAQTSPIRQLTLLSRSEQQQLFQLSQGPQLEVTALPVQQRFESYAQQFPQQIALKESEFHYSYQQLDQHANGLALLLRDRYACQQGQLVAFCVQRGFAQIVTLLAILKAGCCYVPLDPSLPDERLLQILSSYPDLLLLSDEQNASRFSESAVRLIAGIPQIMATQPPELPNWHPALPLYVLHTSGSTGKPKAVEMSHGALASFLAGIEHHEPLLQGPKRMLQFASIGFDMSFTDIFLTLGHGGCLTLIPAGQQYDPAYLTGLIKADQLSVLNLPYAMLVALATYCVEGNILLPEIRCLVSTAEQLKISPVLTDFFSANPHIALVNHYGPTETHVVTAKRLTGLPGSWPALPDIGHPIANVQTLILDSSLQLVPRGVVGELYLAGQSLATGYLGEAELTRQSFIENPFYAVLPVSGPRLYKTGDLVRWRQDGTLEYLGRNDFQVKIRGFRVELGDVEHALRQCGVAECLVMAVPDAAGDLRLVAYVRADAALDVVQLQQEITTLLPVYMVPAAVVAVEKFALNANGKIDRKALPKPDIRSQQLVYQAPQTATEQVLAGIWQQLLAIEQVGRLDNFFMLGGHSLLATRLASQIRQQLGVDLPLHVLFSAPQLHVIAGYLDSMLLNTTEHGQFADDCVEEGFI